MCEFIKKDGNKCKIPASPFCHIHKKSAYLKLEIKSLNKTLIAKSIEIKTLKSTQVELIIANREIENLAFTLVETENELENAKSEIESMKEDFEQFQIIKRFENIKAKLSEYVDVYNYLQMFTFLKTISNRTMLTCLFGKNHDNFCEAYEKLRVKRNQTAHWV